MRLSDGAFVRKIGQFGDGVRQGPLAVCLSRDGTLLFVTASNCDCVVVYRVSDGARVRTIGSPGQGDGQFNSPHAM